jgi:predicted RNA-binding Zn ribbon-like protein
MSSQNGDVHWLEVEGVPLPKRYGGHPALDFCNTWTGWDALDHAASQASTPDPKREWLPTYDRFALWSSYVELLGADVSTRLRRAAQDDPSRAAGILRRARVLRAGLYRLLLDPGDRSALEVVGEIAQSALRRTKLEIVPTGGIRRLLPDNTGLELPLLAVALSAEQLLTSEDRLDTVRACAGQGCGWLFFDSRGRRRWCDMATCGNRAKVRAHSARSRSQTG